MVINMKLGKATQTVLNRSVFKNMKKRREDVLSKPRIGLDANGIVLPDGMQMMVCVATVTGMGSFVPVIAVNRALNNIYASKGQPYGITVSLTLPKLSEESLIKAWTKSMDEICEEHQVDILGGQTTISAAVLEPILTVNALGIREEESSKLVKFSPNNQSILLTKQIGMEGTIRMAECKAEELCNRYTKSFVAKGQLFVEQLSLRKEYELLKEYQGIYMHDVSEGGIFGALWELSEYLKCGLDIDLKKIPMKQETIEFCEFFDINPYMLVSGGSALIVTDQAEAITSKLEAEGILVTTIGSITSNKDKIIRNEDEYRYLEPLKGDEIYKVL